MANTNVGISNFVYSQAPFFVRNDHPAFIKFIEAYYQYLEQEGKTIERAKGFREALDVDRNIDLYSEKLYSQFLSLIPEETIADRDFIIKHIKDFYRARGTEKSIEFLLAILYDLETDFYYPKRDILKASDGKWYQEKSLKVYDIQVNNTADPGIFTAKNFAGRQIRGLASNATATVESVDVYYENGVIVKELKVSNQVRDFSSGEKVSAFFEEEGQIKYISANVFSGIIVRVDITERGNNYSVGDQAIIESNTGTGGIIIVSSTSKAAIRTISPTDGGAGFQNTNVILISSPTGTGANAYVSLINADESVHPNTYNIVISLISREANTAIGNALYSNLVNTVSDPANNWIGNSMIYFRYANTGPIQRVVVLTGGNNYLAAPTMTAAANTRVKNLGILGKMRIVSPGSGYAVNDEIEIINRPYATIGAGTGARGYVATVNGTGAITSVKFKAVSGHYIGGSGYNMLELPTANIITTTGVGGNVTVSAILGFGETLTSTSDEVGAILELSILSGGSGYATPPTINLKSIGSGTAQAVPTIVQGVYTYPGRYLNDDGHLSSFNFLQDGKYYHNYSYVVKIKQAINNYRKALKDLVHPAGMSLFGEYTTVDNGETMNVQVSTARTTGNSILKLSSFYTSSTLATYNTYTQNVIVLTANNHGLYTNDVIRIDFYTGDLANLPNRTYTTTVLSQNTFRITTNTNPISNGTANIWLNNMSVYRANHGFSVGNNLYFEVINSTTANITNGILTIVAVANSNTYNVVHTTIASSNGYNSGNAYIGYVS
jgi:hypothetical protein